MAKVTLASWIWVGMVLVVVLGVVVVVLMLVLIRPTKSVRRDVMSDAMLNHVTIGTFGTIREGFVQLTTDWDGVRAMRLGC